MQRQRTYPSGQDANPNVERYWQRAESLEPRDVTEARQWLAAFDAQRNLPPDHAAANDLTSARVETRIIHCYPGGIDGFLGRDRVIAA